LTRDPKGQLLLDGTMGRIGRMIMGRGDNGTGQWDYRTALHTMQA